jgi:hypothetical protein
MRRQGVVQRICEEEESSGESLDFKAQQPDVRPGPHIDSGRRWLAMALVGAVVGIVAVLAAYGLRGSGAVVEGRGGVAQPAPLAPAASAASASDGAPLRRSRAGSRVGAMGRRAVAIVPAHMTAFGVTSSGAASAVTSHPSASGDATGETHDSAPAAADAALAAEAPAAEAPAGAQSELGFER